MKLLPNNTFMWSFDTASKESNWKLLSAKIGCINPAREEKLAAIGLLKLKLKTREKTELCALGFLDGSEWLGREAF